MRKILFALCLLAVYSTAFSQNTFQRMYQVSNFAFSVANSIQQTSDGGYIMGGSDSANVGQDRDVFLVKTDANGDTLWARSYGTSGIEYGQYAIETIDGGYIVVGTSYNGDWNVYLVKTNAGGDTLWTKTLGGAFDDEANFVQNTNDGNVIIAGYTNSAGAGNYDYFLLKMDLAGTILWSNTYGTVADELAYTVKQTLDKGYIIAGAAFAPNNTIDAYCIKTDSMGVEQWSKYYGTLLLDWGYMMTQTRDSGYVITGYIEQGAATDAFLIRTNSSGDTLWTRTYGGGSYESGLSVIEAVDSGYVITGSVYSGSQGAGDAMLLKTDTSGNIVFCHSFGGPADDNSTAIDVTSDGGYVIGAYTKSLTFGPYQFYLIKTDSAGNTTGNCNEINVSLQTIQRQLGATVAVTQTIPLVLLPSNFITNTDSMVDQFSPCTSLAIDAAGKNNVGAISLSVYPNPSNGQFKLQAGNLSTEGVKIEILNILGEKVYSQNVNAQNGKVDQVINTGTLPQETYLLRLQANNRVSSARLLIAE